METVKGLQLFVCGVDPRQGVAGEEQGAAGSSNLEQDDLSSTEQQGSGSEAAGEQPLGPVRDSDLQARSTPLQVIFHSSCPVQFTCPCTVRF